MPAAEENNLQLLGFRSENGKMMYAKTCFGPCQTPVMKLLFFLGGGGEVGGGG